MSRAFAYVRDSTTGQNTENEIQEIEAAGFGMFDHKDVVLIGARNDNEPSGWTLFRPRRTSS